MSHTLLLFSISIGILSLEHNAEFFLVWQLLGNIGYVRIHFVLVFARTVMSRLRGK